MTKELEIKLVKKYPKILRDYNGDVMQTCMAWGMECDDGWYELLDKCMEKIQYCCNFFSTTEGGDGEVQVIANQIKEKFGSLRLYFSVVGANEIESSIIDDIVSEAERKSRYVCEITGKDGEPCHRGGWYKTLCYDKARELEYVACNESTESYWKEKDVKRTNS